MLGIYKPLFFKCFLSGRPLRAFAPSASSGRLSPRFFSACLNLTHHPSSTQDSFLQLSPSLLAPRPFHGRYYIWTGEEGSFFKSIIFYAYPSCKVVHLRMFLSCYFSHLAVEGPPAIHPSRILQCCVDSACEKGALRHQTGSTLDPGLITHPFCNRSILVPCI